MIESKDDLRRYIGLLREALRPFVSDATLFVSAEADQRATLRPAMYFSIADYDRARAIFEATRDVGGPA
jgi:hypothetical protein